MGSDGGKSGSIQSSFAPLRADGPLPGMLSARTVKIAFRHVKCNPKQVLRAMGYRKPQKNLDEQLRRALDRPERRAALLAERGAVPPLHQALYTYCRRSIDYRGIYQKVVEPALVTREDKEFLDPARFEANVAAESARRGANPFRKGDEDSDGLAMLALAFGLLQSDASERILAPLIAASPYFVDYFGVAGAEEQDADREVGEPALTKAESPEEEAADSAVQLRQLEGILQKKRSLRQKIGAGDILDESAFERARAGEREARSALNAFEDGLREEVKQIQARASEILGRHIDQVALPGCDAASPSKTADWIDRHRAIAHRLESLAREYDEMLSRVDALDAEEWRPGSSSEPCTDWNRAADLLQQRIDEVRKRTDYLLARSEHRKALRRSIQDCIGPRPAQSLQQASGEDSVRLFELSFFDPAFEHLQPLLLRLVAEQMGLAREESLALLERLISAYAERDDPDLDDLAELLQFLPPASLQDLLRSGKQEVVRVVVLVTLRASLAQSRPLFFNVVWGCQGWRDRSDAVGRCLADLFDELRHQLSVHGSVQPIIVGLGRRPSSGEENEPDDGRVMEAAQLADRLERPTGMTGHYRKLRISASQKYFRPLAQDVRARRAQAVQKQLASIRGGRSPAELAEEVLADYQAPDVETVHQRSVTHYIEDQLRLISEWVQDELALERAAVEQHSSILGDRVEKLLAAHSPDQPLEKVGSLHWLEAEVARLVRELRGDVSLDPTFAFFAELPSSDGIVPMPEEDPAPGRPDWLPVGPRAERTWRQHWTGGLTWIDLLQDGLARALNDQDRSPTQIVAALVEVDALDAAEQAAHWPEFCEDQEVVRLAAGARECRLRGEHALALLSKADRTLQELERDGLPETVRDEVDALQERVYEALEALDADGIDGAEKDVFEIERCVAALLEKTSRLGAEGTQERDRLREWLAAADSPFDSGASVEELKERQQQAFAAAESRLVHFVELERIAAEKGAPPKLAAAVREYVTRHEHPRHWPGIEGAQCAAEYLELLRACAADWWTALRMAEPGDRMHVRIHEVVTFLRDRIAADVDALVGGRLDDAIALGLLLDPGCENVSSYHQRLVEEGRIEGRETVVRRRPVPLGPIESRGELLEGQIAALLHREGAPAGSAETVLRAFALFQEGSYREAREAAASAWRWAVEISDIEREHRGPLTALYGWTRLHVGGFEDPRTGHAVVGLLIRHQQRIASRLKLTDETILDAWRLAAREECEDDTHDWLVAHLGRLSASPAGDQRREQFEALVDAAGPREAAPWLWRALTSHTQQQRARVDLLLLLYDLGEQSAIDRVFTSVVPTEQRYLTAFLALVERALHDPSPQLHSAVRQSFSGFARRELGRKSRPLMVFAEKLMRRLRFEDARVGIDVSRELEPESDNDAWRLIVTIRPEESDPPLSLTVELLDSADFDVAGGFSKRIDVTRDEVFFESREIEFLVRPNIEEGARFVALRISGETSTGQPLQRDERFEVALDDGERFESIPVDELLELYEGYDGRAVSGTAFVGREEELEILRRQLITPPHRAVVLYGARRLGKTSVLDALRERNCVAHSGPHRVLVLTVATDLFEIPADSQRFHDAFLGLVYEMVLRAEKNAPLRRYLARLGVNAAMLENAMHRSVSLESAPMITKLGHFLDRLKELTGGRIESFVLIFDEFDKLLEAYRKDLRPRVEEVINQLRHAALEKSNFGVVLAGSDLMKGIFEQYRNALFGSTRPLELKGFDGEDHRDDARQIIAPARLGARRIFAEGVVERIVEIAGGHPLYMRMIGCAATHLSRRRRISIGSVHKAVAALLENRVLPGDLIDPPNLVKEPQQALKLMESDEDEILGRLLLLQMARVTSLERQWTSWHEVVGDDTMRMLRPQSTWTRLREALKRGQLIRSDARRRWSFRFPILGEALRKGMPDDFDAQLALLDDVAVGDGRSP